MIEWDLLEQLRHGLSEFMGGGEWYLEPAPLSWRGFPSCLN